MSNSGLLALGATCLIAGWTDWRWRIIPNWLTIPAIVIGFVLTPWPSSLQGVAVALAIHMPFFFLGYTGGGDVKLMAALGSLFGFTEFLPFFVLQAIVGGIAALVLSVYHGQLSSTLRQLTSYKTKPRSLSDKEALKIPRGVIVAGSFLLWLAFSKIPFA